MEGQKRAVVLGLGLLLLIGCKKKTGMSSEIEERHRRRIAYCETFLGSHNAAGKADCYERLAVETREMALCARAGSSCPARIAARTGKWEGCEGQRVPSAECFMLAAAAGAGPKACAALRKEGDRLAKEHPQETNLAAGMHGAVPTCNAVAEKSDRACATLERAEAIECLEMLALGTGDATICEKIPGHTGVKEADQRCYFRLAEDTGSYQLCMRSGRGDTSPCQKLAKL